MRGSIKGGLAILVASSIGLTGCMTRGSKEWVDSRIRQEISQYKQEDEEKTRKNFEAKAPLEQLTRAFYSTHQVINKAYYETREGKIINPGVARGSSILLRGGYLLTAKHVVDERFPREFSHSYWGLVKYHHNEVSLIDKDTKTTYDLKKILLSKYYDYALFKVKNGEDLTFYNGLNLPDKIIPGMQSAAIGFPLSLNRNIRLGNLSQINSGRKEYLTFKNSIIPGDSGGPIFVKENGDIKLVAISTMLQLMRGHWDNLIVHHPVNIGYGLKIETIIKDIKRQLKSSNLLDEETAKELENLLRLNK